MCKCTNKFEQSRRQFLRTASLASMSGLYASPFILGLNSLAAMAQGTATSDYRALVCVFLQGGNDGHGTVIATDSESYAAFTQARSGAPGLAYPLASLLPITPNTSQSGRTFALNPYLTGVQNLFNAGRAAVVANTGTQEQFRLALRLHSMRESFDFALLKDDLAPAAKILSLAQTGQDLHGFDGYHGKKRYAHEQVYSCPVRNTREVLSRGRVP